MMPRVGLVTVLYNSVDVLPGFFESLAKQDYPAYWLYVIDNSPNDKSFRVAEALAKQYGMTNITFIRNADNRGVATGNNQGIKPSLNAGCEYVLLLNNDIEFSDTRLLSRMVELADSNNEAMVVPKIYYHGTGLIWCAGGDFNCWRGTTRHRGDGERDGPAFDIDDYTDYAPTCFMLIRRAVFERVGLMDERYFVYYDDADFLWRANVAGFRLKHWADGKVWHKVSSSTGGAESTFSIYYGTRNRVYFIRKHLNGLKKIVSIIFLLSTRIVKALRYNSSQRAKMWQALKDGFAMRLEPPATSRPLLRGY